MTVSAIGGTALVLVTIQLAATAVLQRGAGARLHWLDMLGIVPGWTFFVQPTAAYDVAIDVRWQSGDGQFGAWHEGEPPPLRRALQWLWHPEGFGRAALWLAIQTLEQRVDGDADTSFAYRSVLDFARSQPRDPGAGAIQFALVRLAGDTRTVQFQSSVHPC